MQNDLATPPEVTNLECPIPNEKYYTNKIVSRFKKVLTKAYPNGETLRMFHPKIHGLLKAEFIISPNLEEKYRIGIFKEPKTFKAWIRLSNAKRKPSPDKKQDMRGFAIKLMGVEGKQLLEENEGNQTQDFLLVTSPILQTKSIKDFQVAIYALTGGFITLFFYAITHIGTIIRSLKMVTKCYNLLNQQYFSTVPSKFGNGNRAVKYSILPQVNNLPKATNIKNTNYLKDRLIEDLKEQSLFFDFMVQFQSNPKTEPIEDPRKEWKTPWVKLATIKIPSQKFNWPAQYKFAENLSFNPWHGIEEHQPIGGANRARRDVYRQLSAFRHERNEAINKEPNDWIDFNN